MPPLLTTCIHFSQTSVELSTLSHWLVVGSTSHDVHPLLIGPNASDAATKDVDLAVEDSCGGEFATDAHGGTAEPAVEVAVNEPDVGGGEVVDGAAEDIDGGAEDGVGGADGGGGDRGKGSEEGCMLQPFNTMQNQQIRHETTSNSSGRGSLVPSTTQPSEAIQRVLNMNPTRTVTHNVLSAPQNQSGRTEKWMLHDRDVMNHHVLVVPENNLRQKSSLLNIDRHFVNFVYDTKFERTGIPIYPISDYSNHHHHHHQDSSHRHKRDQGHLPVNTLHKVAIKAVDVLTVMAIRVELSPS
ncbi:hypothetical protein JHK86_009663 [Glycine max]|nr:hypothetical protein JHK86_009663 [Glycine max]